ncbi:acyltransferase [Bradyrhizobium genosp. L]|uniref:acyltransferase family protein n=1 Tax=Bradyrhizobium genosp. L TaxID=83637 RepID=UPI0018A2DBC6|nr:acyltransferase [Bradyrhizobium genosp. L]QPF83326.1 acyltransferase [Bradyrhizobium genosp. L]
MVQGQSIGNLLDRQKGFGPGFDFLRIALAVSVVAAHTPYIAMGRINGPEPWYVFLPHYAALVIFFALGGFLVAASGLRLSLKEFLINRGLRIVPALAVEIVLSALILGPIFTTLPLSDYFTSFATYRYFGNIAGLVTYLLPGVFTGNPAPEVNSSLWTIPFEYICYVMMMVVISCGLLRRPVLILLGAVLLVGIGLALDLTGHGAMPPQLPPGVTATLHDKIFGAGIFLGRGSKLLVAFILGMAIYLYRYRIPYDGRILAACCALCLAVAFIGPVDWMTQPLLNATICPALVYITAYIGVSKVPKLPIFSRGDYSYGIYLYGFPLQQVVKVLLPHGSMIVQFSISFVMVTMFAAFSWHWIEKPVMKLRSGFSFVAPRRLAEADAATSPQSIAPLAAAANGVAAEQPAAS